MVPSYKKKKRCQIVWEMQCWPSCFGTALVSCLCSLTYKIVLRGNLYEKKNETDLTKKKYHDKKNGPLQFQMPFFCSEERMVCEILTLIWLCGRCWAYLLCGVVALLIRNVIKIQDKHHHHTLLVFHRDYVSATLKIRPCKRDKMSTTTRKKTREKNLTWSSFSVC